MKVLMLSLYIAMFCVSCMHGSIGTYNEKVVRPFSMEVKLQSENSIVVEDGVNIDLLKLKNMIINHFNIVKIPSIYNEKYSNYVATLNYIDERAIAKEYGNKPHLEVYIDKIDKEKDGKIVNSRRIATLYPGPLVKTVTIDDPITNTYLYRQYMREQAKRPFSINIFSEDEEKTKKVDRLDEIASSIAVSILDNMQ